MCINCTFIYEFNCNGGIENIIIASMLARDSSPISSKMSALNNSNSPASSSSLAGSPLSKITSTATPFSSGSPKTKASANQFQSKNLT